MSANGVSRGVEIVRTRRYLKDLKRIGAPTPDITAMESSIVADPTIGVVIPGLGGVRKLRFKLGNKGKRGGGRAVYYFMTADDVVLMLAAYAKNDKSDLTSADRRIITGILKEAEGE